MRSSATFYSKQLAVTVQFRITTALQIAARFWTAAVLCRFGTESRCESGRGLPHSKTLSRLLNPYSVRASKGLLGIAACALSAITAFSQTNTVTDPDLARALSELTRLSEPIPFKEVVEATTHHHILDFNTNNPAHFKLEQKILAAAKLAGERAVQEGIFTRRPNEAGNHLEPFVRAALRDEGLDARVPVNTEGNAQVTGYPDVEIAGPLPCYLELKTFNASTENSSQRTFYYSPSAHPKVTHDAFHLLLAYQLERTTRDGKTDFVPQHWKLITLQNLMVHLKFEFNQSNRGLYGEDASDAALADGDVAP